MLVHIFLGAFRGNMDIQRLTPYLKGMSHAEIIRSCIDAKKEALLSGKSEAAPRDLERIQEDRRSVYCPDSNNK